MAQKSTISRKLKERAHELGFHFVGVTSADPPPHLEVYQRWLDHGRHGEMAYLASERARERRADPDKILPGCQSILVLGTRVYPHRAPRQPGGKVAAYALGQDYHDVLLDRMDQLLDYLRDQVEIPFSARPYTDTGPLLERELAQRAGMGWIGKNTCLIHPAHGSYILLSEILLDLELEQDPPFEFDHCGSCTRCIDACPTECILPDRTLDARRCISYLTIELKGPIPEDIRSEMGDWLFGCDVCQQVCPWNQRFATSTDDRAFSTRPFLDPPQTSAFLHLTDERYRRALQGSPLKRPKRRGLVRNAAVAAGNSEDPQLVRPLIHVLQHDPDPLPRAHAAWALGTLGGDDAIRALQRASSSEQEPSVREEIINALSRLEGPQAAQG